MRKPGVTRRELASALAVAAPVMAQAPAPAKPTPESELEMARDQQKRTAAQLRSAEVSVLLEPSFVFRP